MIAMTDEGAASFFTRLAPIAISISSLDNASGFLSAVICSARGIIAELDILPRRADKTLENE
jgi:hypothetical protein